MRATAKTVWKLVPPVVLTVGASVGGLMLVRALVPAAALQATNDVVGNFLQTLGTIYAVLLAFVVFVVWQQFTDARLQVEREANNLLDLARTSRGLPAEEREAMQRHIDRYVALTEKEWAGMVRGDLRALDEGWLVLDAMSEVVRACRPHDEVELAHVTDMLARLDDLSDSRGDRIGSSTLKVPLALRLLLYFGAVMTIGSMYLFAVDSFAVHALLVALLSGAISHILYLIHDLDDRFDGDFSVSMAPFERVRRHPRPRPPAAG